MQYCDLSGQICPVVILPILTRFSARQLHFVVKFLMTVTNCIHNKSYIHPTVESMTGLTVPIF